MASTAFPDVAPWPETKARDPRFDNQPPLEERVMLEFEEELEREGVKARIQELLESASRVPTIKVGAPNGMVVETLENEIVAGKVGDLCRMARDVEKRVSDAREKHNRPLLTAQRSLKGKADGLLHPLLVAISDVKGRLNTFMAEQARIAREEEARRAEEARKLREEQERLQREAEQAGAPPPPEPAVEIIPQKVEAPVARGDLGARVGTRTVWKHAVEVPIAKLPKSVLENEKVKAAVDQVLASMIRTGTREIKGVRIWSEQVADVR